MDGEILEWGVWSNHEYQLHEIKDALDRAEAPAADAASGASIDGRRTVKGSVPSNVVPLRGVASATAKTARSKSMLANAKSGLELWRWVESLTADELDQMVQKIAADAAMKPLADSDRSTWLRLLFGFAAFEAAGAVGACEAAREWSKTSPRYLSDADFDRDWQSFDPMRPDGITVGTVIHRAEAAGINLEPWRERARARQNQRHDEPDAAEPEIPRGSPLSQLPEVMGESLALAHLNARFFKTIRWGNTPSFGRFDADGSVHRLKPQDLQVALAGNFVDVPQPKGPPKPYAAAKWWVDNPKKVTFDRVMYDPEHKQSIAGETNLNLWNGFAVQPKQGSWRRMRRHIYRVICGRDRGAFKYLMRWLAFCVQFPGTAAEVMVVLRSDLEGVGKSSLGMWMIRIFGQHRWEVTNYKMIFGDHNDLVDDRSFILLEEPVFPGDHQAANILKAMITARKLTINPKGVRGYTIPNTLHVMMTTNGQWAIPAGADARRFLMLDVKEKMDRAYFDALWQEANDGGIEGMLFDLLRVDLSHFNPREVPVTDALIEQQDRSADSIGHWIEDCVHTGVIIPHEASIGGGFNADWPVRELHGAYKIWCSGQGVTKVETAVVFGRALGKMGLTRRRTNNPPTWTIPDPATLRAASDRRSGIRRKP